MPGATVGVGETNDEGPGLPLGALSLPWQRDMLVTLLTPQETQISSVLWEHWWALAGEGSRRRQRRRANSKELAKGLQAEGQSGAGHAGLKGWNSGQNQEGTQEGGKALVTKSQLAHMLSRGAMVGAGTRLVAEDKGCGSETKQGFGTGRSAGRWRSFRGWKGWGTGEIASG